METLNFYSAPEIMKNYIALGTKKSLSPVWRLVLLGITAGLIIGIGGVVSNTAVHAIENPGIARVVSGLIFPFGLGIVMLTGFELFTGNCMIITSVFSHEVNTSSMLRNWFFVYIGNLAGGLLLALGIVACEKLDLGNGALAAYTVKVAADKCAISFGPAFLLGVFCNILVCLAVLCSLSAKDTAGRIMGAYIPVSLFVIGGFEHSIANMYYIPAGLFAMMNPTYAAAVAAAGIDTTALTWSNFFVANLLPVTIGNIVGGAGIALLLWCCHVKYAPTVPKKEYSVISK